VTPRAEMRGDQAIGCEKALGMARGLESPHTELSLASRLVRILRTVIEVPVLAVLHPRRDLLLRGAVAFQLVGDDHPRHISRMAHDVLAHLHLCQQIICWRTVHLHCPLYPKNATNSSRKCHPRVRFARDRRDILNRLRG
jgi:hypothetical protein